MKNMHISFRTLSSFLILLAFLLPQKNSGQMILPQEIREQEHSAEKVRVISTGMNFELPESIPYGWTTFEYQNKSPDTHFFVLEKMPEGKNIENTRKEIIPVFTTAMEFINNGNSEQGFAEFSNLPAWFFDVVFTGGPGLIAPGHTAETTVHLTPGTYILECYVKMPNGMFHSAMGMIGELEVTAEHNGRTEPEAHCEINISTERGIEFKDILLPGSYTFAVNFEDQQPHENFVGHDVHLVRFNGEPEPDILNSWMNWANADSFKTPLPAALQFLGGTQEMPAGKTSYFTATLRPGNYAFVAEVPDPRSKKMLQTFSVPGNRKK